MSKRKKRLIVLSVAVVILGVVGFFVYRWLYGPDTLPSAPELSWVREPDDRTRNLVVFVHGIGSNSTSAWTSGRTGAYWPKLLKDDPDLNSFGQYAPVLSLVHADVELLPMP